MRTGKGLVLWRINFLARAIALLAAVLLLLPAASAQASGMALADEDMLSDVSAQVGIGLVLEGGGDISVIAFRGVWTTNAEPPVTVATGTLSYRGVSITGNGTAGNRFSIGQRDNANNRAFLDVGTNAAGTQTRMRLRFPNMFSPDQPVTIRANNSWWGWHNGTGAQYLNLGEFRIDGVYHNNSQITLWAGNGGARGLIELNAKVSRIENRPTRAAGLRGFRFDNFVFSGAFAGSWADPSNNPGTGYASFGRENLGGVLANSNRVISIDVYTDRNFVSRSRMRIIYTTTGTAWIQRTGIIDSAGNWVRDNAGRGTYGPVVLDNWTPNPFYRYNENPGHIEITMPIRTATFRWVGP
ncbi:MAG: hypothetical protein QMD09_07945 [Desulfatibacillaceae bacterium]|nr:hypothetical protein [Desulfatibacillaceae bacterium]